jgi:hypothetical protein
MAPRLKTPARKSYRGPTILYLSPMEYLLISPSAALAFDVRHPLHISAAG